MSKSYGGFFISNHGWPSADWPGICLHGRRPSGCDGTGKKWADKTGRTSSVPAALATGVLVSFGIVMSGAAMIATLIQKEVLEENLIRYGIPLVLITASYMGCRVAYGRIKEKKLMISMLCGVMLYSLLLAITALFLGGQYDGIGVTGLLILCGSVLNSLPSRTRNRGGKGYKI